MYMNIWIINNLYFKIWVHLNVEIAIVLYYIGHSVILVLFIVQF